MSAEMPDFKKMTPEEVAAYIERRRVELQAVQQEAKKVGVVVKDPTKQPKEDKDKLEWLFERLGYQTGMRKWANGRMAELLGRVEAVTKISELSPQRLGKLLAEASEGFRKARIGTSFESTSMPDKKEANGVPTSEVFGELYEEWRATIGPVPSFLVELLAGVEVEEVAPAEPSDRELFKTPSESNEKPNPEGE